MQNKRELNGSSKSRCTKTSTSNGIKLRRREEKNQRTNTVIPIIFTGIFLYISLIHTQHTSNMIARPYFLLFANLLCLLYSHSKMLVQLEPFLFCLVLALPLLGYFRQQCYFISMTPSTMNTQCYFFPIIVCYGRQQY